MNKAVIGLGFGDEGKGLVTSYLCSQSNNPLVIRYSGGQQAGHTVVVNNIRHVFSNYGSGTLQGHPTYWSDTCTMSPNGIINEYKTLINKGVKNPQLVINYNCPVTTPYDMYHNLTSKEKEHGTCGLGINATWRREEKLYSLRAIDILYPTVFKEKLKNIREFYGISEDMNNQLGLDHYLSNVDYIRKVLVQEKRVISFVDDTYFNLMDKFESRDLIFESSQGLLLDEEIGFYPNVTASVVGLKNIKQDIDQVYYVTRAYQTRHGNGFMTNKPLEYIPNPNETNVYNEFQGEFRTSMLDLELIKYSLEKERLRQSSRSDKREEFLVITCLDQIKDVYSYTCYNEYMDRDEVHTFSELIKYIKYIIGILDIRFENVLCSFSDDPLKIQSFRSLLNK